MLQSASHSELRMGARRQAPPPRPLPFLRHGRVGTRTSPGRMSTALIASPKGLCPLPEGSQTRAPHREPYPSRCQIESIHPGNVTYARGWCALSACNWKNEYREPLGLCCACVRTGVREMAVSLQRHAFQGDGPTIGIENAMSQPSYPLYTHAAHTEPQHTMRHVRTRSRQLFTVASAWKHSKCPPVGMTVGHFAAIEKCLDLCVSAKGQPRGVSVMCQ